MTECLQIVSPFTDKLSGLMNAIQDAAIAHAYDLHIDHDRMLADFGCLWMIARSSLRIRQMPEGSFYVKTWLRRPTAAVSVRDFTLFDSHGVLAEAAQSWVLVSSDDRKIVSLKTVPPIQSLPTPQPERKTLPRRVTTPETAELFARQLWRIRPEEIDGNGHLNNVAYICHAEALVPERCNTLEVVFDRECFAGETLLLEAGKQDAYFVRGVKESGEESFRARFGKEETE